nr:unnamed protein product [Digitaria exilis]
MSAPSFRGWITAFSTHGWVRQAHHSWLQLTYAAGSHPPEAQRAHRLLFPKWSCLFMGICCTPWRQKQQLVKSSLPPSASPCPRVT